MSKLCLDNRTTQGLVFFVVGLVLLLLGYFKNFSSVLLVIGALAALCYGAIILGLPQRIMKFIRGFKK